MGGHYPDSSAGVRVLTDMAQTVGPALGWVPAG
jgi:hypothetical protein